MKRTGSLVSGLLLIVLSGSFYTALAVPASPVGIELHQPEGTIVGAMIRGDEWNNHIETANGYTVKKAANGFWRYVLRYDDQTPVLSGFDAHRPPPVFLRKHIHPIRSGGHTSYRAQNGLVSKGTGTSSVPTYSGAGPLVRNVLFIMAEFSDRTGTYSEDTFASLIRNGINDYFSRSSNGSVTVSPAAESFGIVDNGVIGWVNLGYAHPAPGDLTDDRNRRIARDAINAANPYIDYRSYDSNGDGYVDSDELAVVIIVAGYEASYDGGLSAPSVWAHMWSLSGSVKAPLVDGVRVADGHNNAGGYAQFGEIHRSSAHDVHQATIGVMVHELGHLMFFFPDLYDTDGSSEGAGVFCVMASGSWGRASSDPYAGQTPVLPSAWIRYSSGWVSAATGEGLASITAAGSDNAGGMNTIYFLPTVLQNEYFLVENRYPLGYDRGLQGYLGAQFGGLAVWHIDENTISAFSGTNSVNDHECYPGGASCIYNHYGVALAQADGAWQLEKGTNRGNTADLWYSGNRTVFDASSMPDSDLYNGGPSNVIVKHISSSGEEMTLALTNTGGFPDGDADGYDNIDDCNDNDPAVHPGAPEECNETDDDCDGNIDEGFDEDADGVSCGDNCPSMFNPDQTDSDGDGVGDTCDNCRFAFNTDQRDTNSREDDNVSLDGIQHYGNICDPDLNNDGMVNLADYAVWRGYYRMSVPPAPEDADLDGDGAVDLTDYTIWRQYYRGAPGPGI